MYGYDQNTLFLCAYYIYKNFALTFIFIFNITSVLYQDRNLNLQCLLIKPVKFYLLYSYTQSDDGLLKAETSACSWVLYRLNTSTI